MLIHNHGERTTTATAQATPARPCWTEQPSFGVDDLLLFGLGCLIVGFGLAWIALQARVAAAKDRCVLLNRRWLRAIERHDQAKQVIARMVDEEARGRRTSVVA